MSFDGGPRFLKNLEINFERRVKEDGERLSFLIQYCERAAKEVIDNCVMLPSKQGYHVAKQILRKTFGQKHTIVLNRNILSQEFLLTRRPEGLISVHGNLRSCLNWLVV